MIDVAMDVHVRSSVVHATDGAGQAIRKGKVGNSLMEIAAFLAPVEALARERREPVRVTIENTTNARGVLRMLEAYGRGAGLELTARAVDPRKMRVIAESVCKCDRLDAATLNELSRANLRLPVCYFPDDDVFALREHLRARADLVRMRTMAKNRLHALLHRRAILAPEADLFSRSGRAFLAQVDLDPAGGELRERWLAMVGRIDEQIDASDRALRTLAATERWREQTELLRTMPGVGLVTALTVLAELGDIHRFRSRAAVANYAGLVPILRESNGAGYRGGITRRGPALLRAMLTQAAWVSIRRVPVYASLHRRISERSNGQKAVTAVARRMLEDLWTMLRKKETFRYARADGPGGGAREITDPSQAG